ncbi:UDP binding domain-containing protein, partial [Patescibacteria group bacterium]
FGLNERPRSAFINAGIGYGGLCFPKDIRALIRISERIGYKFKFLDVVEEVNKEQRIAFVNKMKRLVPKIRGKKVALLGLSFKPKTDDMREAPSIDIIERLQKLGAQIHATDPVAIPNAREIFGKTITYHKKFVFSGKRSSCDRYYH